MPRPCPLSPCAGVAGRVRKGRSLQGGLRGPRDMTNWETTHDVRACIDCVTFSANGADGMDAETVARVLDGFIRYGSGVTFDAYTSHRTGEWLDYGFTWDRCDVCGLDLGHEYVRGSVTWRVA